MSEQNNRALLTNKIRQLSATRIKTNKIISYVDDCPSLKRFLLSSIDANLQKK